ncbi:MAG TPA: hypothetical protein VGC61_06905 [Pyrinomonadaceae bacterium]|jgi:hypothetical protein
MTTSSKHIPFAELADLADEQASADKRRHAHLSECSVCAQQLDRLGQVLELMRSDNSTDAPRDVLAYAMNIFSRPENSQPSLLRRLVAALSFDSSSNLAPAFGVRAGQATSRQLLYSAEENDIDIRITPEGETWIVAGQVLGEDCSGGRIEIEGAGELATAELNDLCEFTLPPLPAGSYAVRLRLGSADIEIPKLELSA